VYKHSSLAKTSRQAREGSSDIGVRPAGCNVKIYTVMRELFFVFVRSSI
jgi:hypothetical protein